MNNGLHGFPGRGQTWRPAFQLPRVDPVAGAAVFGAIRPVVSTNGADVYVGPGGVIRISNAIQAISGFGNESGGASMRVAYPSFYYEATFGIYLPPSWPDASGCQFTSGLFVARGTDALGVGIHCSAAETVSDPAVERLKAFDVTTDAAFTATPASGSRLLNASRLQELRVRARLLSDGSLTLFASAGGGWTRMNSGTLSGPPTDPTMIGVWGWATMDTPDGSLITELRSLVPLGADAAIPGE